MAVDPKNPLEPGIDIYVDQLCEEIREIKRRTNTLESQVIRAPGAELLQALPAAAVRKGKLASFDPVTGDLLATAPASGTPEDMSLAIAAKLARDGSEPMTGALTLPGNASSDLHAIPRQQLRSTVGACFRGLAASATGSSSTVSVSADEVVVRNASGDPVMLSGLSLSVNSSSSGANGLDTGTLATNTWYAIWVIWDGVTTAALISTSATAPTMPAGYTHKARVGWIRTDGTVNKYPIAFVQRGKRVQYALAGALTAFPQMFYGITSGLQAVAVGSFCPTTAGAIALSWGVAGNGSGASIAIGPSAAATDTSSSGFAYIGSSSVSFSAINNCLMVLESSSIYVSSSNANGFVGCTGWEDNL